MRFPLKVRLLTIIFFVGFVLVLLRLIFLQIFSFEKYAAQAEAQHFYSLYLPARRGEILASDKIALASNKNSYLLYAHLPQLSGDRSELSDKIAQILAQTVPIIATDSAVVPPDEQAKYLKRTQKDLTQNIIDRLSVRNALWVNLAHFLDPGTKTKIESLSLTGLGFTPEEARDYPEASMAAHLLGFVGSDQNGNPKGYFGLEGYYDRELSGRAGELRIEKDALGRPIAIGNEIRQEKQDGRTLVTTIDRGVQHFVETNLKAGISDWQAAGGTAIVMDAKTGAILALVNFPNYDPGRFPYYPTERYKNPAVANLFEPGSIMKPIIMAAAINDNKLTPESRCDKCDGPRQIYNFYIHTFDNHYHPNETMTEVLINSDNTGMVFVGEKLGFPSLLSYLSKFGFGQKTSVDLEEEEGGSLGKADDYYPIDQATMAFGQGINVNALQMVRAFGALANGGQLPTPYLVSQIIDQGQTINLAHPPGPRVVSENTAQTITQMLVQVANKSPEHFPKDRIPLLANFQIAAKSGTAQIAVGGKYQSSGTIASVIGYFPAANPRFVILAKLNQPEIRPWGSDTAGPIFFAIVRDLIQYYGISP
ncbi:penicillin-binding protein 2 [Candidatus Microgenomates bacterium]|nr:penicillin-binding protein 2 [Candidatus Microgenomates bacterium]